MKKLWWMAFLLLFASAAAAQQKPASANPVSDAVRSLLASSSKNLIGAFEEMPAEKYSFRPTAGQMSFGKLALHIVGANDFLCSSVSGQAKPQAGKLTETSPKPELVAALKASFDYCATALEHVDDAGLSAMVPFFGGHQVTRATGMIVIAEGLADHYAMAAMYLRLNGLLPPTAQRRANAKEEE